jgi:hypothetical protein
MKKMYHLDIDIFSDYCVRNTVKLDGEVVNKAYFTRSILGIITSSLRANILVQLPGEEMYIVTNDQDCSDSSIYIVDAVAGKAPKSLEDLAEKLAALIKV